VKITRSVFVQFWNLLTNFVTWLISNWLLVLTLALGCAAVWGLLPQPRRQPWRAVAVCGGVALLFGGASFLELTGNVESVLFCIFAGLAVVSGVCMITQRNPVYTALWFALVILSTCGLFLLQSAPFLAAATIIVYAGAIIVTFLFVIMLAQQSGLAEYDRRAREPALACIAGFVLLTALIYVLQSTYNGNAQAPPESKLAQIKLRLAELEAMIATKAPMAELDNALWLEPQLPLGGALREEVKKLPLSAARVESVDRLLPQLAGARAAGDHTALTVIVRELRAAAEAGPHVTALGTSLFGDYLWAVELAGTLLLVATVGAIAIAQRRREVPA
jgi:NADH-quinone oxidoreductase subunit J